MQNTFKWKTYLGLILVLCGIFLSLEWIWGILFLFWAITDLVNGRTYFIEDVNKRSNPFTYWLVVTVWFILALLSFIPNYWWYR